MIDVPATFEDVDALVRRVAARYKRRCWWAPVDDLQQCGWIAALECASTFDPRVGVPYLRYAERAMALQMREVLWRASAPVSACKGHSGLEALAGLIRAPETEAHAALALVSAPDEQLGAVRWLDAVTEERCALRAFLDPADIALGECVL